MKTDSPSQLPQLPNADICLLRNRIVHAVSEIMGNSHGGVATQTQVRVGKLSTVFALHAIHDCEFSHGSQELRAIDVAPLIYAGLARWKPTGVLGVDEAVLLAAGSLPISRADYASRWN